MNKPTVEEIIMFLIENKGYQKKEAEKFADKFWNYYESVGWTIGGKKKMVSWTAAIRTWELKNKENGTNHSGGLGQKPIPTGQVSKGGFGKL